MKVLVSNIAAGPGGGGTYLTYLTKELTRQQPRGVDICVYTNEELGRTLKEFCRGGPVKIRTPRIAEAGLVGKTIWEQLILPFIIKREKYDVLFCPGNICTLLGATPKLLMLQHEIIKELLPPETPWATRAKLWLMWNATKISAKRANTIAAISNDLAERARKALQVNEKNIRVIYHGVDERFKKSCEYEVESLKRKYSIEGSYLLYVGSISPHKNLEVLIRAYRRMKRIHSRVPMLVLAGEVGSRHYREKIMEMIGKEGLRKSIKSIGHISHDEIPALYSGATAFLMPSKNEAFCIPVLEAMACGVPVIASSATAMPEICGNAALYFNPDDDEGLVRQICRMLDDEDLRSRMAEEGLLRASSFSWKKAANELLTILEETSVKK